MAEFIKKLKVRILVFAVAFGILLTQYSYFWSDTVMTKITDAQMTKVYGRFMITTEYRPLVNEDATYRFPFDSGTVQNDAIRLKGKIVKISKYGWRITVLSWYENVVRTEEVK